MTQAYTIGDLVEREVIDSIEELDHVPDDEVEWHDAIATAPTDAESIDVDGDVPVVFHGVEAPIEAGTPVEIKAARYRVSDGSSTRRGRFYYRRGQHSTIRSEEAVYIETVYAVDDREDDDGPEVYLLGFLVTSADVVDDAIGAWVEVDRRATSAQVSWTRLPFPDAIDDRRDELEEVLGAIEDLREEGVPTDLEPRIDAAEDETTDD